MNWIKLDDRAYFVCAAISILIQLITLIKLARNGKYRQGILITVFLIISNIA